MNNIEFLNPKEVLIRESRWSVEIDIIDANGISHQFVASADSYYTEHDHIWFGTAKETAEWRG